jgi:outer membrane lipopolysaccharide assembly protein LptE/RlpB
MRWGAVALVAAFSFAGCGYHTSGKLSTLPTQIQLLSVPTFVNHTHSYRVEQVMTAAVVRELTTRTQYKIENQDDAAADATLRGDVMQTITSPVTYDSTTGRASSSLVTVVIKISLVDKKGTVLFSNPSYTFREEYQISRELSSFFDEESPALDRMSRDMARSLVSNILEGF